MLASTALSDSLLTKEASVQRRPLTESIDPKHTRFHLNERFIVIWLDSNIDECNDNFRKSINQLQYIISSIKTFTDVEKCVDFLKRLKDEKVFIIVSDTLAQQFVSQIQNWTEHEFIYIFCSSESNCQQWAGPHSKVKGVYTQIESIFDTLERDIRRYDSDLTPIQIIDNQRSSTNNLNELELSFMYSKLLKESLLEMKYDNEAKNELIEFFRAQCSNDLHKLNEFEQNYNFHSPIWWYTKESFIYSTLNKALRTQDIDIIIKMGFFLQDLHRQIEQLHSEMHQTTKLVIYRGQGMSMDKFATMRKNQGGLLSFNNFLSTSTDYYVSLAFANGVRSDSKLIGILFRMEVDPLIASTPFASLDKISFFSDSEKEILFSMHAIFRIGEIQQIEERLWQVHLTLTSENDEQLNFLTEHIRKQITRGTALFQLGQLMFKMGKFRKAEEVYNTILQMTSNGASKELATVYHYLGYIYQRNGDLTTALAHYKQSVNINLSLPLYDDSILSQTYSNIGRIHWEQNDFESALEHYERALNIDLQALQPDQLTIATRHTNIGMIFEAQGKYTEAFNSYERTLKIEVQHLPDRHASLITSHMNLGRIHHLMNDYRAAISYYEKVFEFLSKQYLNRSELPAEIPFEIVRAYHSLHECYQSIDYGHKNFWTYLRLWENHRSEMRKYRDYLDKVLKKNDFDNALEHYERALNIDLQAPQPDQLTIATRHTSIGMILEAQGKYTEAFNSYERALKIELQHFPDRHPSLITPHMNLGRIHHLMNDYRAAISYYEKAFEFLNKQLKFVSELPAEISFEIARAYRSLNEYDQAIDYAREAIHFANWPRVHHHSEVQKYRDYVDKLLGEKDQCHA